MTRCQALARHLVVTLTKSQNVSSYTLLLAESEWKQFHKAKFFQLTISRLFCSESRWRFDQEASWFAGKHSYKTTGILGSEPRGPILDSKSQRCARKTITIHFVRTEDNVSSVQNRDILFHIAANITCSIEAYSANGGIVAP